MEGTSDRRVPQSQLPTKQTFKSPCRKAPRARQTSSTPLLHHPLPDIGIGWFSSNNARSLPDDGGVQDQPGEGSMRAWEGVVIAMLCAGLSMPTSMSGEMRLDGGEEVPQVPPSCGASDSGRSYPWGQRAGGPVRRWTVVLRSGGRRRRRDHDAGVPGQPSAPSLPTYPNPWLGGTPSSRHTPAACVPADVWRLCEAL